MTIAQDINREQEKQKRVKRIVKEFQKYVRTYTKQILYHTYSDQTIIDDMLYGLGLAFSNKFLYSDGYREWKKILRMHLNKDIPLRSGGKHV